MTALRRGSYGGEVTLLQEALVNFGYYVGQIDGEYGPKTEAAVSYLQSTHGLDIDGEAGEQVHEILDIGVAVSLGVDATWPDIDVWEPGQEFVVSLEALGGLFSAVDVRVVVWFRTMSVEEHTEAQISLTDGQATLARFALPKGIAIQAGEVYWTAYVFDMSGNKLSDEGAGSFRIDRPEEI